MGLDLLTPIGLGLLGFLEPCSLGANAVFLGYLMPLSGWRRVAEALTFTLSRGAFLGLIGAAAGALGGAVRVLQRGYIVALGVVFVFLGLWVLAGKSRYMPRLPTLQLGGLRRRPSRALLLGVLFGLSAPACATPLLAALVAQSLPLGAAGGFVTLFVFGVAMSVPLIGLAVWRGWQRGLERLSGLRPYLPVPDRRGTALDWVLRYRQWLALEYSLDYRVNVAQEEGAYDASVDNRKSGESGWGSH